jgi:hypothetical protein
MYITVGLFFLAMTYAIIWGSRLLEYRLSGHLRDRPAAQAAPALVAGLR